MKLPTHPVTARDSADHLAISRSTRTRTLDALAHTLGVPLDDPDPLGLRDTVPMLHAAAAWDHTAR